MGSGDGAGGDVGDADGGFDFVDVLPAFAARAVSIGFQIGGVDLKFAGFIDFGDGVDAGEAGVAALV